MYLLGEKKCRSFVHYHVLFRSLLFYSWVGLYQVLSRTFGSQSRGKKKIFREVSPKCTFLPWGRSYRLLNPPIETSVFVVPNGETRMARESGGLRRRLPGAAAPSAGRFPRCPPAPEVTAGVNGAAQQRGSLPFYVDTFLTVPFKRA